MKEKESLVKEINELASVYDEEKIINKVLIDLCSNISDGNINKILGKPILVMEPSDFYNEKDQGTYGEAYKVFNLVNDKYLKVNYTSDSYGDNVQIASFIIVKKVEKEVIIYE